MAKTVVILLSDKRSGSTMFEREFCKHAGVNHVSYTPHAYNETHYWLKAACLLSAPRQLFYGNKRYRGYGSRADVGRSLIEGIQGNVPDFKVPDDDKELVFEGWNALCAKYAAPVFFEKSPQHPHHWAALDLMLKWARATNYRVLFIGLIRNPMAVMYSARQLFHTDPFERQFSWANANRNILLMRDLVGEERFHLVRYEDLVETPAKEFAQICRFVGIDYHEGMGGAAHKQSKNKWHDDQQFILQLHDSVIRLANHFGYSDEDLYNPPKPLPSVSQRISRNLQIEVKRTRSGLVNKIKRLMSRVGVTS